MGFSVESLLYKILIDPILSRLHDSVLVNIESSHKVIDIACGTGSLSLTIAEKACEVTGIDLSASMISTAVNSAGRRGIKNAHFLILDANELSMFRENEFDVAVTSMAIHQFDQELAVKILTEMKRIASKVIIIDYNYPLPKGFAGSFANFIERFAGGDHYRNFKVYMKHAGILHFIERSGLEIKSQILKGRGVFLISICRS